MLGAQVAAGISGYGEFQAHIESKKLRAIAISAPARVAGIDVPTLKEQGVNLDFGNWRGVVAPAGISAGDKQALLDTIDTMAKSGAWKAELRSTTGTTPTWAATRTPRSSRRRTTASARS